MSIMKTRSCGNAPGLPAVWLETALPAPLPSLTSALLAPGRASSVSVTATGFLGAAGATALGKGGCRHGTRSRTRPSRCPARGDPSHLDGTASPL